MARGSHLSKYTLPRQRFDLHEVESYLPSADPSSGNNNASLRFNSGELDAIRHVSATQGEGVGTGSCPVAAGARGSTAAAGSARATARAGAQAKPLAGRAV